MINVVKSIEKQFLELFDLLNIDRSVLHRQYAKLEACGYQTTNNSLYTKRKHELATSKISGMFHLESWQSANDNCANNIDVIYFCIPNIDNNIATIANALFAEGFFMAMHFNYHIDDMDWAIIQFDPLVQEIVTKEIKEKYQFIFHLTTIENLQLIKEDGVIKSCSKNKLFHYPSRCFLLTEEITKKSEITLANMLYDANNKENAGIYALLKIDLSKIDNDLYYDGNYKYGIFTETDIPISSVVGIKYIDIIGKRYQVCFTEFSAGSRDRYTI